MHPSARTLTVLSSLALASSIASVTARDAELAAAREAAHVPGKGCPGCAAATKASPVPTMCEPCRAIAAALDAARDALRTQPLPAAFQMPDAPRGPNRAQRRRAMFRNRRAR